MVLYRFLFCIFLFCFCIACTETKEKVNKSEKNQAKAEVKPEFSEEKTIHNETFSFAMAIQKKGTSSFVPFSPNSHTIDAGDFFKVKLDVHQDTYLTMVLRDANNNVQRIFPLSAQKRAEKLEKGKNFVIPTSFAFNEMDKKGTSHLCFLYGTKEVDCSSLCQWVGKRDIKKYSPFQTLHIKEILEKASEEPLPEGAKYVMIDVLEEEKLLPEYLYIVNFDSN